MKHRLYAENREREILFLIEKFSSHTEFKTMLSKELELAFLCGELSALQDELDRAKEGL